MKLIVSLLLVLLAPVELARGMIDMRDLELTHKIFLITTTTALEAEGESYQGKLGVAYVIVNIMTKRKQSALKVVFKPYAFSVWNTRGGRQRYLDRISNEVWDQAEIAAYSAYFHFEPDPTFGADHYLNVELTKKIRKDGRLPRWVSKMTKTVKIGRHTFYREGR